MKHALAPIFWLKAALWLAAAGILLFVGGRVLDVQHGLTGVYFDGAEWRGPFSSRIDPAPTTAYLKAAHPSYDERAFSVEWHGFIAVPRTGRYTVATVSDDGSFLSIDNVRVVDNGGIHPTRESRGTIALDSGVHAVSLRYFQNQGDCAIEVLWGFDGAPLEPVPAGAWLTRRAGLVQVRAAQAMFTGLQAAVVIGIAALACALLTAGGHRAAQFWSGRTSLESPLAATLLFSLALNVWGIWWALPNERGWAPDELVPEDVWEPLFHFFAQGWHTKYPLFHYMVLSLADLPVLLLSGVHLVDLRASGPYTVLFLISRFLSVAFGAGTIVLVYRAGRELYGQTGAMLAALTLAVTIPFAYYGKLANLEMPYLFWFALSLLAYIRILKSHRRRDYILFAASAALAVCTKDQAYGLYVLAWIPILVSRYQAWRSPQGLPVREGFAATPLCGLGAFVLAFAAGNNLFFNFRGFVAHVHEIVGPASTSYQMFPATASGQLRMAAAALHELGYMFGMPLAAVVAASVLWGLFSRFSPKGLRSTLVPALSYYVTFIAVVLYFYDRFLLPIAIVLALFTGGFLEWLLAAGARRRLRAALVGAVFLYSAISAALVDRALTTDSRYAVTRWIRAHAGDGEVIGSRGPIGFFMIAEPFTWTNVDSLDELLGKQPRFVVLDAGVVKQAPPGSRSRTMYDALRGGQVGYRLAAAYRTPPPLWPGLHPDLEASPRTPAFSSLAQVNPQMEIYERVDRGR